MTRDEFIQREHDRAKRLSAFVQDELRHMFVEARMSFTLEMFNYLTPELKVLLSRDEIKPMESFR